MEVPVACATSLATPAVGAPPAPAAAHPPRLPGAPATDLTGDLLGLCDRHIVEQAMLQLVDEPIQLLRQEDL